jgi:hypothetical protein
LLIIFFVDCLPTPKKFCRSPGLVAIEIPKDRPGLNLQAFCAHLHRDALQARYHCHRLFAFSEFTGADEMR